MACSCLQACFRSGLWSNKDGAGMLKRSALSSPDSHRVLATTPDKGGLILFVYFNISSRVEYIKLDMSSFAFSEDNVC